MAGLPNEDAGIDDGTHVVQNNASTLAEKTQANVEAAHKAQIAGMDNPLSGALGFFFNTIMSGFETLGNFLEMIIHSITGAIGGTFQTVTDFMSGLVGNVASALGGVADLIEDLWNNAGAVIGSIPQAIVTGLSGALSGVNNFVQSVVDGVMGGVRGIPIVGAGIADMIGSLTGYRRQVEDTQVNQQNFTITSLTTGYRNPTWVARYPIADVTYPEALNVRLRITGRTAMSESTPFHDHSLLTANVVFPDSDVLANGSRGGFITVSNTTVFDTAGMILRASNLAVNGVFIDVFRQAAGGNVVLVASTADLSGSLSATTFTYVEAAITPLVIAAAGERYLVRVRNTPTSGSFPIVARCLWQQPGSVRSGFYVNGTGHNSSAYSAASLAVLMAQDAADALPWAMLATKGIAETDQSFSDDFNRVSLGGLWFLRSDTGASNVGISGERAAFVGSSDGNQLGLYIRPTSGDQMLVEANVYDTVASARLGVMSCCNRELTQTVYLAVDSGLAKLYTGAWNSLTERLSVATTADDAKWGLYNEPSSSEFFILKDGTDVGSWVDSGGVVLHGSDYRYGGIRISRASGVNGGTLDNWTLRDYAA